MENSSYVITDEGELGLGPDMEALETAPKEKEKTPKKSFWENASNVLSMVDQGADTVNKVLNTGKKAVDPGVPAAPAPGGSGQGDPMKLVLYTAGGAAALFLLMKMVGKNK